VKSATSTAGWRTSDAATAEKDRWVAARSSRSGAETIQRGSTRALSADISTTAESGSAMLKFRQNTEATTE
jgi:hypothetical protein